MTFYNFLDKKKSIAKAKLVLDEYARFIKILDNNLFDLSVKSSNFTTTFSSSLSADARLINYINYKDRNYKEIYNHVQEINNCINCLRIDHIELLNMKYIEGLTNDCIAHRYSSDGKVISTRQIVRRLKEAHIEFSISYGVYVIENKKIEEKRG